MTSSIIVEFVRPARPVHPGVILGEEDEGEDMKTRWTSGPDSAEVARLRGENERLRAALRNILKYARLHWNLLAMESVVTYCEHVLRKGEKT